MESVKARGFPAVVENAAHLPAAFSLSGYSAAMLVASVHGGRHEPEMIRFVKRHLAELEAIPSGFISVSLSEAGAEDVSATPESRAKAVSAVNSMIATFLAETGWRPAHIKAVAGALLYSKYNFLLRLVMRQIAHRAGGSVETSAGTYAGAYKDTEYTDWAALDSFAGELVHSFPAGDAMAAAI